MWYIWSCKSNKINKRRKKNELEESIEVCTGCSCSHPSPLLHAIAGSQARSCRLLLLVVSFPLFIFIFFSIFNFVVVVVVFVGVWFLLGWIRFLGFWLFSQCLWRWKMKSEKKKKILWVLLKFVFWGIKGGFGLCFQIIIFAF